MASTPVILALLVVLCASVNAFEIPEDLLITLKGNPNKDAVIEFLTKPAQGSENQDSVNKQRVSTGKQRTKTIMMFEHDNYVGGYQVYTGSVLEMVGFHDITSSIVANAGTWAPFEHSYFIGRQWIIEPGAYSKPDAWQGEHDQISSVKLICA